MVWDSTFLETEAGVKLNSGLHLPLPGFVLDFLCGNLTLPPMVILKSGLEFCKTRKMRFGGKPRWGRSRSAEIVPKKERRLHVAASLWN